VTPANGQAAFKQGRIVGQESRDAPPRGRTHLAPLSCQFCASQRKLRCNAAWQPPAERTFLSAQGGVSVAATLRAMARTGDGRSTLVEVKAVASHNVIFGAVAGVHLGAPGPALVYHQREYKRV